MTCAPRLAAVLVVAVGGCVEGPAWEAAPAPDTYGAFVARAEPVLEKHCANPSCHGRAAQPLEVYAPGHHRLDANLLHLPGPLDETELRRNYARARAFVVGAAKERESLLLTKPLAREAGGVSHAGGVTFEDRAEADFLALEAWVLAARGADGGDP